MTRREALSVFVLPAVSLADYQKSDPPALPNSGMPFLTNGPDGTIHMSWIDTVAEKEHALRFSRWNGTAWSAPETIAQGRNWFVNWADFPSIVVRKDGSMLAHWLTRAESGGTYGYGIRVAKRDRGAWRQVHGMSLDEKVDYAGFLSFSAGGDAAAYLSPPAGGRGSAVGHDAHGEGHRKTLRVVAFTKHGLPGTDVELDADTCSCCPTAIVKTPSGYAVAYRDHMPGEIRDISIVRFADGVWTEPKPVHKDGWKINGCPTDGPGMAAMGASVAVAWLTRAEGTARVQAALSSDEAKTFGAPVRIDSGNPLGRPGIVSLDGDGYLVWWLERVGEGVEIRLRRVMKDGQLQPVVSFAKAPAGRASGFPKLAVQGDQILIAWRDERVRAALLTRSQLKRMEGK